MGNPAAIFFGTIAKKAHEKADQQRDQFEQDRQGQLKMYRDAFNTAMQAGDINAAGAAAKELDKIMGTREKTYGGLVGKLQQWQQKGRELKGGNQSGQPSGPAMTERIPGIGGTPALPVTMQTPREQGLNPALSSGGGIPRDPGMSQPQHKSISQRIGGALSSLSGAMLPQQRTLPPLNPAAFHAGMTPEQQAEFERQQRSKDVVAQMKAYKDALIDIGMSEEEATKATENKFGALTRSKKIAERIGPDNKKYATYQNPDGSTYEEPIGETRPPAGEGTVTERTTTSTTDMLGHTTSHSTTQKVPAKSSAKSTTLTPLSPSKSSKPAPTQTSSATKKEMPKVAETDAQDAKIQELVRSVGQLKTPADIAAGTALVKQILNYQADPSKVSSIRGGQRSLISAVVAQIDPSFDFNLYASRANFLKEWNSSTRGAGFNIIRLNTAMAHLGELQKAAAALNNSDIQAWNFVTNYMSEKTGDPRVDKFNTVANAVESEMATLLKNTSGTDQEIKEWRARLTPNKAQDQFKGIFQELIQISKGRMDALTSDYERTMGKPAPEVLSSDSKRVIRNIMSGTLPSLEQKSGNPYR